MKIGFLIVNRANWARSKTIAMALVDMGVEVKIYSASSMNLEKFGTPVLDIEAEQAYEVTRIMSNVEGSTLETQALSTGILVQLLTLSLSSDKITALVVVADRYEVIAGAIASSYLNIPLIHIQGGEISGNIDNKVRFAVSAFADLHFPCSEQALSRLKNSAVAGDIINYGCPAMDLATSSAECAYEPILTATPHVGKTITDREQYCLVTLHPDTERYEKQRDDALTFFEAINDISLKSYCAVIWPNVDGGADSISKVIRGMRESGKLQNCGFYKNINADDYPTIVKNATICLGNSSSFLREAAHFGTPSIIVGTRQNNRDNYGNAYFLEFQKNEIVQAYDRYSGVRQSANNSFGSGNAGKLIAQEIVNHFS